MPYKIHKAVTGAQFDAIVGNVNTGFFSISAKALHVSILLPPPTANIISAICTVFIFFNRSIFSRVALPPYQIKSNKFIDDPFIAVSNLSFTLLKLISPPITIAVLP